LFYSFSKKMVQVHLSQESFSLGTQLRSQQQEGEMTDTVLVCETGERVAAAAHLAVRVISLGVGLPAHG
jgi:hypothetical protein